MRTLGRSGGVDTTHDTPAQDEASSLPPAEADDDFELHDEWSDGPQAAQSKGHARWVLPTLALLVIAGWSGFYAWALRGELAGAAAAPPSVWTGWIADWSVPVLLVGVIWLIAMRSSRAEASRFAASAALLSRESAQLEDRLKIVNRELSLAREFLASQSRDLESLGRVAAERISTHAASLQQLIVENGAQVEAIGSASETALGNMNRLRDDLPVVANSARDVANQIGGAGRNAHDQLERLIAAFERLNQFGTASENQVAVLSRRVGDTLTGFEAQLSRIEGVAAGRFEQLQAMADAWRTELETIEGEALTALRQRIGQLERDGEATSARLRAAESEAQRQLETALDALHDRMLEKLKLVDEIDRNTDVAAQQRIKALHEEAGRFDDLLAQRDLRFNEEIERRQSQFETREAQATEVLAQRLAELDDALALRREGLLADTETIVTRGAALGAQLDQLRDLLAETTSHGEAARTSLASALDRFGEHLTEKRRALGETQHDLAQLTEAGIRLLEIIQSGARSTREDLPKAIETAEGALAALEGRAADISQLMLRTGQDGSHLSDHLVRTRREIAAADASIAEFGARLSESSDEALARLQGLRAGFARLSEESTLLASDTQDRLRAALAALEQSIVEAFAALDRGAREKAGALAETISGAAVQALERALRDETEATIVRLEQSAAQASGAGREATILLRDQLSRVNELTGNLEQRIARARELAEEQVNNDFARRMALITDSLNSAAIDISAALSTEVADTAWDAYLKGDRGIFTRRAVRLIDGGSARDIARLYQQDDGFRGNVSRYIHDFEAMLRAMLSTRDGHALGVTVLSSDMGKLYVVLAQAIQRFRA